MPIIFSSNYHDLHCKHYAKWSDVPYMKESPFYKILRNITAGGKKQTCVDCIKDTFHTDKGIGVFAPASSIDWTSQSHATYHRSTVFNFFSTHIGRG